MGKIKLLKLWIYIIFLPPPTQIYWLLLMSGEWASPWNLWHPHDSKHHSGPSETQNEADLLLFPPLGWFLTFDIARAPAKKTQKKRATKSKGIKKTHHKKAGHKHAKGHAHHHHHHHDAAAHDHHEGAHTHEAAAAKPAKKRVAKRKTSKKAAKKGGKKAGKRSTKKWGDCWLEWWFYFYTYSSLNFKFQISFSWQKILFKNRLIFCISFYEQTYLSDHAGKGRSSNSL